MDETQTPQDAAQAAGNAYLHFADTPGAKDDFFKDIADIKLVSIKEVMQDIDELITVREQLHTEIFKDIDKMLISLNNFTANLEAKNPEMSQKLADLKKKQMELEQLKVDEKLNKWRDIALLKRELRERVKEYKEKENSINIIDKILDE